MAKKPRSLKTQLLSAIGRVWMFWSPRLAVKRRCKDPDKPGWYKCEAKGCSVQIIEVDHTSPVVKPEEGFQGWDIYLANKFVSEDKLTGMCHLCHREKTRLEGVERRAIKKAKK